MDIISVAGLALIATILVILLKQYKPEIALIVGVAAGIFIFLSFIFWAKDGIEYMRELSEKAGMSAYHISIVLKVLGICYITQFAADACKDAGETAMGSKMELAGRAAVLAISLPLFKSLVTLITGILRN